MSEKKNTPDSSGGDVTVKDLFGSIPRPADLDPFEGIDLKEIAIAPKADRAPTAQKKAKADEPRVDWREIAEIDPSQTVDPRALSAGPPGKNRKDSGVSKMKNNKRETPVKNKPSAPAAEKHPAPLATPHVPIISKAEAKLFSACEFAEIHRLREMVVKTMERRPRLSILTTAPHDEAGNTFLVSVLGINMAKFSSMKILLVDLNMRNPQIHQAFGVERETGFTEVASNEISWKKCIKGTDLPNLKIMTAGKPFWGLSKHLERALIHDMIEEMKNHFHLILIDTSPVLIQNKNNVDPVLLSLICDLVMLVAKGKKTTVSKLKKAVNAIVHGGGHVHGIVYNRQH